MALGRRCDNGCETWPDDQRYKRCPACGQHTTLYKGDNVDPLSESEANLAEFQHFYRRWDAERSPKRLSPNAANAAGRFRDVSGLIAASQAPRRAHRLSPPS